MIVVVLFVLTFAIGFCAAFLAGGTVGAKRQSSPGTSNGKLQATHGCTLTSEESEPAMSTTNLHPQPGKAPKPFNGNADCFAEWAFSVDLALRSYGITRRQVDFATSFFEGSALLWFLARRRTGAEFVDGSTLNTQLEETFGSLHTEEDSRLDLFSLTQTRSQDEYIREFSHLSLKITDLDEVS